MTKNRLIVYLIVAIAILSICVLYLNIYPRSTPMSTKINIVTVDFEVDNFMLAYEIRDHQICGQLHTLLFNKRKYSVERKSLQKIGRI